MRILLASVVSVFVGLFIAAPAADAADMRTMHRVKAHKRVAQGYHSHHCRVGWWYEYCDGAYRPRWGRRCG